MKLKCDSLFALCFLSIFVPFTVYPVVFFVFSILVFARDDFRIDMAAPRDRAVICAGIFTFLMVSISWINKKPIWCDSGLKVVVNMLFLVATLRWSKFKCNHYAVVYSLAVALTVSVLLTAIQVVINATLTGAWLDPFVGVSDSVEAYKIVAPGVYWGLNEKNIWATKIALQSILLFFIISRSGIKVNWFLNGMLWVSSAISIVYTFSRTAQGIFFIFLVWEFYLRKINLRVMVKKPLFVIVSGSMLIFAGWKVYDKLFHLTLKPGDGMESRIRMWGYLWETHELKDFWLGKGYLYGKDFLPAFRMVESNFHNVFINILVDSGFMGLMTYLLLLMNLSKVVEKSLLSYLIMASMVQYMGYDNDIVAYLSVGVVLGISGPKVLPSISARGVS